MPDKDETKQTQGEKVDEINSEITEIIGLQKKAAEVESEFSAVQAYDALILKIGLHIRSRAKDNKHDKDLKLLENIIFEHRNDMLENIKSEPRVKDWLPVIFMQVGSDITTKTIIPSENFKDAYDGLKELAYARLKEKRVNQYQKMLALISDEFDLHRDLTDRSLRLKDLMGDRDK